MRTDISTQPADGLNGPDGAFGAVGPVVPTGLTGGGPALFRLVRFWSRRWAADAARQGAGDAAHVGHVLVLEAIDAASTGTAPDGNPTADGPRAAIGDVAVQLGLDRSNASRMLASAVAAGLVTKTAHPADARRTELAITPPGRDLLAAARSWQDRVFARLVADWPAADARRLAGYLERLADQSITSDQSQPDDQIPGGRP